MTEHTVVLDKSVPQRPRLVIDVPPEQQAAIEEILTSLERARGDASTQTIVLDALRIAVGQSYFWTPAWQAKEQEVDRLPEFMMLFGHSRRLIPCNTVKPTLPHS